MSKTRKISECVNVRINVGNYQHIELTKYAEEEITYETKEELIEFENDLTTDLVNSLVRSMSSIPKQLGKGVENAQEVEEAIATAIPEWLANSPLPNIANQAKQQNLKVAAQQKDNKDKRNEILDVEEVVPASEPETPVEAVTEVVEPVVEATEAVAEATEATEAVVEPDLSDQGLFEDDEAPVASEAEAEVEQETTEVKEPVAEKPAEEASKEEVKVEDSGFDFYDDEDLFGD